MTSVVAVLTDSSNFSLAMSAFTVESNGRAAILYKCCRSLSLQALYLWRAANSSFNCFTWLLSGHSLRTVSKTKLTSTHYSTALISTRLIIVGLYSCCYCTYNVVPIGHVNNIPAIQFFTGISRNVQSKSYTMLTLMECVWDFQNNALWDTHWHALFSKQWM